MQYWAGEVSSLPVFSDIGPSGRGYLFLSLSSDSERAFTKHLLSAKPHVVSAKSGDDKLEADDQTGGVSFCVAPY